MFQIICIVVQHALVHKRSISIDMCKDSYGANAAQFSQLWDAFCRS